MTNEELLRAIKVADDVVSMAEGVGILFFSDGYCEEKENDLDLLKRALEEAGVH